MVETQIYFLLARSVGLIKIGRSIDVRRRIQDICTMSPVPLELIGVVYGTYQKETEYHQRWAGLRRHGEWFEATDELMTALEADGLVASWNRARQEARDLALEQIDMPVRGGKIVVTLP